MARNRYVYVPMQQKENSLPKKGGKHYVSQDPNE